MGSTKVKMPKVPEIPGPPSPPPMPTSKPAKEIAAPRMLQPMGATPDIRIGSQKTSGSARNRNQNGQGLRGSLSISDNKGLNV